MENARILVVEDEGIVAKDLIRRLQQLGHTVLATASSGHVAVQQAVALTPDVVLMDIHLPGEMDGIEAADQIRVRSGIPVIYVTGQAQDSTLQRAKVTEPFGYVLKPFDERELSVSIEMALYRHRMEETLRERERSNKEALEAEAAISTTLARMGRELSASLDTSTILDRLCQLTVEALSCDCSHTILWQAQDAVYTAVAEAGNSPEQWETIRALRLPPRCMAAITAGLEGQETIEAPSAAALDGPFLRLLEQLGITRVLFVGLRRGTELLGIQTACYRGQSAVVTPIQQRIAGGIAQIAVLALDNARLFEQAQDANRLKSDFLATMSHELRTPLNIILGYTQLLLQEQFGSLAPMQRLPLHKIDANAHQLLELVVALLDISRLEVGRLPVAIAPLHVSALVEELHNEIASTLEKPHLRVQWPTALNLPTVLTDRMKLKVILKNLLSNALKFTDSGGVNITVRWCDDGIEFSVSDTGIGMEPHILPIIFEPFRQGEQTLTRRHRGVGLGLYIVKRLLDTLGGTIAVSSEVGKGSSFRVWIPVTVSAPDDASIVTQC
jgi:signal transduction histidine kinase/CheY-like chemotaxis protein